MISLSEGKRQEPGMTLNHYRPKREKPGPALVTFFVNKTRFIRQCSHDHDIKHWTWLSSSAHSGNKEHVLVQTDFDDERFQM